MIKHYMFYLDISKVKKTVGNHEVRNLVYNSSCQSCSLNSYISGEVMVNETWHKTQWYKDGSNLSRIKSFELIQD